MGLQVQGHLWWLLFGYVSHRVAVLRNSPAFVRAATLYWVAVKELKLSYYIGETLLFTIYTHYGNLI